MNRDELIRYFVDTVEEIKNGKDFYDTYYYYLCRNEDGYDWAIVIGWQDGFDDRYEQKDGFLRDSYRLCVKLAYQPSNSLMQCDYGIDWIMPYNEETMEVDDTEVCIYEGYNAKEIIDWLLECYYRYNMKELFY